MLCYVCMYTTYICIYVIVSIYYTLYISYIYIYIIYIYVIYIIIIYIYNYIIYIYMIYIVVRCNMILCEMLWNRCLWPMIIYDAYYLSNKISPKLALPQLHSTARQWHPVWSAWHPWISGLSAPIPVGCWQWNDCKTTIKLPSRITSILCLMIIMIRYSEWGSLCLLCSLDLGSVRINPTGHPQGPYRHVGTWHVKATPRRPRKTAWCLVEAPQASWRRHPQWP